MLKTRVLAALVFAPPFLWLVWRGGLPLGVASLVLAALMLWEFFQLTLGAGARYFKVAGIALGLVVALVVAGLLPAECNAVVLPVVVLLLLVLILARPDPMALTMTRAGLLLLGALYGGALIQYLALLRALPSGLPLALMALFCTWGADTGAYFSGRFLGRHKLYPKISPAKTVEGAVGALVSATLIAFVVRALPSMVPLAWRETLKLDAAFGAPLSNGQLVVIGVIAAVLGIAGDLCESMLKRSVGAKDASRIIPGHGGVLDRFDGVLFVAAGVYVFAKLSASM